MVAFICAGGHKSISNIIFYLRLLTVLTTQIRMAMVRLLVGYPWVSDLASLDSGMILTHSFKVRDPETYRIRFQVWFFTRGYSLNICLE
jgi:hypothetical protein